MQVEVRSNFLSRVFKIAEAGGIENLALMFKKDVLEVRGISTDSVVLIKARLEYINKDEDEERTVFVNVANMRRFLRETFKMEIEDGRIILKFENKTLSIRLIEEVEIKNLEWDNFLEVETNADELSNFLNTFNVGKYDDVALLLKTDGEGKLYAEYSNENISGRMEISKISEELEVAIDITRLRNLLKPMSGGIVLGLKENLPLKIVHEAMGDVLEIYLAPIIYE